MSDLALARGFPQADEAAWKALVEKALRGADFEEALVSGTADGIRVKPLYTRGDETARALGDRIAWPERGDMPWDIRQLHGEPDPAAVNAAILADLQGGASSIALQVESPEQFGLAPTVTAFDRALENVYLDFAAIALEAGEAYGAAAEALTGVWQNRGIADDKVSGAFGADPLGTLARVGGLSISLEQAIDRAVALAALAHERYPQMTALLADGRPYHDGGASEAQELACLCATSVAYLRALEANGLKPQDGLTQIGFALSADGDQFLTIAKLRAARALLDRIADACGAAEAARSLPLHVETSARMMTRRDMYVNLLRTTVACAAAAMGGADSISVRPFTDALGTEDAFGRRIARNIQIILAEESGLGQVVDPSHGSWYVETLSQELADKAWGLFQDIERQGGMAEALASGWVQSIIRDSAGRRAREVADGEQELTGVSAFPALDEPLDNRGPRDLPDTLDDPAVTVEPLPLRRPAEPFEALRDAADAHAAANGERAKVFLANLGRPSDYNERSRYARNLFGAGGIAAAAPDRIEDADAAADAFRESGAKLACLCSSDTVYEALGEDTARALKAAGAGHIYLVGRPGSEREKYRAAGVDTFIHRGIDMLDVLKEAQSLSGVEPT